MKSIVVGLMGLAFITVLGVGMADAQSAPPKPKSPAEIAVASKLLAEKNESCRQQARAKHLHLLKRRHFMRDCRGKP
jgi:hypothetical protein